MVERGRFTENGFFLKQLRIAIPFLQQIPEQLYLKLDITEFHLPKGKVSAVRGRLEEKLGQHVMTYKRDVFNLTIPVDRHLCANLKGADLSQEQLDLLQSSEGELAEENVSLVVYQNPIELIDPADSAIAKLYKEKGFL